MRRLRSTLTALSLLLVAGVCHAEPGEFLEKATQNAMTQVELGKLAQKNARSMGVNALGTKLARDHGRMNRILALISQDKGVTVPTALDNDHRAIVDGLSTKTGTEFDIAYTALMVNDQANAIALYTAAADGDDPDLAAFAKSALPVLREEKRLADSFHKMTASYRLVEPAVAQRE